MLRDMKHWEALQKGLGLEVVVAELILFDFTQFIPMGLIHGLVNK